MVTRQPQSFAFTSPMPRPHKLRHFVSNYCIKITRRRMVRESIEAPPPLPPKEPAVIALRTEMDSSLVDMQRDYAAHVVFLAQIDNEAATSHRPYHDRSYAARTARPLPPPPRPEFNSMPQPTSDALPRMLSLEELRRRRVEVGKRPLTQFQDPKREETERQARIKREKDQFLRQLEEEERQRKLAVEEDLKRAAAIRQQKEEQERREEDERRRAIEERRSLDRARRIEQAHRLQAWRDEQARRAQEEERRRQELRNNIKLERRLRPVPCVHSSDNHSVDDFFEGWITVQLPQSTVWRRRFCRVRGQMMEVYKDSTVRDPLDAVDLSSVRGIHEKEDGYEELEGIPFSFALKLSSGGLCNVYTDNQMSKEQLMSLIVQVCRL